MPLLRLLLFTLPLPAADIQVEVLGLFRPTRLTVQAATAQIAGEILKPRAPVELVADANQLICRMGSRELRGETLSATGPVITLQVPGKIRRGYSGSLQVTSRAGVLLVTVTMDVETAVAAVVASELPGGSTETGKAQAVASRSYYLAGPRHEGQRFCDTTHCQFLKESTPASRKAAEATRGIILTYQGSPLSALYFRSCGGKTFQAADVKLDPTAYPYFSVPCSACARAPQHWQIRLPAAPLDHSEKSRLELTRRFGWNTVLSNDYTVQEAGQYVLLKGKGHGHGVGLCQRGAEGMAASGSPFDAILHHYFPQTILSR